MGGLRTRLTMNWQRKSSKVFIKRKHGRKYMAYRKLNDLYRALHSRATRAKIKTSAYG